MKLQSNPSALSLCRNEWYSCGIRLLNSIYNLLLNNDSVNEQIRCFTILIWLTGSCIFLRKCILVLLVIRWEFECIIHYKYKYTSGCLLNIVVFKADCDKFTIIAASWYIFCPSCSLDTAVKKFCYMGSLTGFVFSLFAKYMNVRDSLILQNMVLWFSAKLCI